MAATKEFFIWPARLKTDLFPTHRQNTPILFISVSPIIQQGPLHRVNSSRAGSIMGASTKRCCSSMLRMKPIFLNRMFRIPFSKFRAHATAQSNCAVFGAQGEGYVRISAFNSRENAEEVARRLQKL